jgi:hypothetical protein
MDTATDSLGSAPADAGFDIDAQLDADLGMDSTLQGDAPSDSQPVEPPASSDNAAAAETSEVTAPESEQPTEAETAADEPEPDTTSEQSDETVDDGTEPADEPPPQRPRDIAREQAYKYGRELAKALSILPPDEDGKQRVRLDPTLLPPVQEVAKAITDAESLSRMAFDFTSGDPANVRNFVAHWHKASPQGMASMAAQLPDYLASARDTQAYSALATPVLQRYMNARISEYQELPEGEAKTAVYYAVQQLHHDLTGKYLDPGKFQQAAPAPDSELARREAYVQQQLRELQQRTQTEEATKAQAFEAGVSAQVDSEIAGMVDAVMRETKQDKLHTPRVYEALKEKWVRQITGLMEKDEMRRERFRMALSAASRTRTQQDRDNLIALQKQRAQIAISATRREYITSATRDGIKQNEQKRTALQQAAAKKAPMANGAPVPQNVANPRDLIPRKKDQTFDDWIDANLERDLSA